MDTVDKMKIQNAIKDILLAIGEDPEREGLKETPARVAKMYAEVFEGVNYTNDDIAHMFDKCFTSPDRNLVVVKDIDCFSYCEHHMALMYNMKIAVAYIPNGKVIGLSKIARICDMVCKRLQIQERITQDVAYILKKILEVEDVVVVVHGEHSCMTARGIRKPGTSTVTQHIAGQFLLDDALRSEVMSALD